MIKNYPIFKKFVPLFFLLCSFGAFSQTTVIINDNFNTSLGNWASGQDSKVFRYNNTAAVPTYEGDGQVVLTGPTNTLNTLTSNVLDLRTYNKIDIKFFLKNWNSSNSSTLTLEYQSSAIGAWQSIKMVTIGDLSSSTSPKDLNTYNTYHAFYGTLLATNYTFSSTSKFRFVYNINGSEQFVIDYITISGTKFKTSTKGPGGVIANLETWLKADQVDGSGVVADGIYVNSWKDKGKGNNANVIDENNTSLTNRPIYKNNATSNINFNPVVYFNNDPATSAIDYTNLTNKATLHGTAGFYTQEQYVVVINDNPATALNAATKAISVFTSQGDTESWAPDGTGIGFGKYTVRMDNEIISYCLGTTPDPVGSEGTRGYGVSHSNTTDSYPLQSIGIINSRNKSTLPGQEIYYNAKKIDNKEVGIPQFKNFDNKRYWLGKDQIYNGSFGGRIAEVITFSSRKTDATERPKIESYLAIKYGITLGVNGASQNYVNSGGTVIWNVAANVGFNFDIAGIGRDDDSELNQKQSKSVNTGSLIAIGLGEVVVTNSQNISNNKSVFANDKDFLVWGNNDGVFSTAGQLARSISLSGTTTTFTPVAKKWKIMESQNDVPEVIISIETSSLISGIPLAENEKHVLVVSDNENFADTDIIDVVPLTINGLNSEVWYDFDGTLVTGTVKYFTIAKATRIEEKRGLNIAAGEFVVGDNNLALNTTAFSVSAWVLNNGTGGSFISKGTDYNFKINTNNNVEIDWNGSTKITSINSIPISKWHHIALTYSAGMATLYIDGILDSSMSSLANPINSNSKFAIGALYTNKNTIESFNGDIDEVRIWNSALSLLEIQYIMNQEIEASGTKVNGKIIPKAITKNDIGLHDWSDLKAYYDMNSFYGTTVEDNSNNSYWARIKYLKKDKQIVEGQTAPIPYTTKAGGTGNWEDVATWTNGSFHDLPNATVTRNGIPTEVTWNIVETAHNITSGDKDITVLGLISKTGKLTMADPLPSLQNETNPGQSLRVTHYLELDGDIDLVGESQLLQDMGSILDQDSGGYIERDQQGTSNSYNYNYWSSSVGPISAVGTKSTRGTGLASTNAGNYLGVNGRTEGLMDGTSSGSPVSINFQPAYWSADSGPSSPRTISTYWLYTFYGADDNYWAWKSVKSTTPILTGEGYTMKGTSGAVAIATMQNYVFRGKPYNGDITLRLDKNITIANPTGDVDRLIGNPYPSALDATKFILDNLSGKHLSGNNIFNGALYFWDHFGLVNSHNLGAYVGGYATRNLTAGAPAISNDIRINNSVGPKTDNTVGKTPGQYIPVNQGFFVITALDASLTGIVTVKGGDIVFKNSQRAYQPESAVTGPSVFMKAGKSKKEIGQNNETIDARPIIRLMYDSPAGYHRQIVIGKVENTSNHFDLGYDAPIADINKEDMYWTFDGAKFVIQGVPNFDDNQEFPLGLIVSKTGLARIKIDGLENMEEDISLHIKDKLTGESHNISKKPFEIDLAPGTYLDRFALTFKMQKLVIEDVKAEILIPAAAQPIIEGIHVFMNNALGELQIKNNSTEEITSIALYNYLGQTIKTWNSNFNIRTISLPLSIATGVYLVQITTKTGKVVKKISVE